MAVITVEEWKRVLAVDRRAQARGETGTVDVVDGGLLAWVDYPRSSGWEER